MKRSIKTSLLLSVLLFAFTNAGVGQPFSFDEDGHGYDIWWFTIPPTYNPLPFTLGPDPSGGIGGTPVLMYSLPYQVVPGDVALMDASQPNVVADLLRFYTPAGNGHTTVIFYSAADAGIHQLAEVGIPFSPGAVRITEAGGGETWWSPGGGQPGFYGGPIPVWSVFAYDFVTEVPEPASLSQAMLGAAGVWLAFRRGVQRAASSRERA
jgi:hypothetical protein